MTTATTILAEIRDILDEPTAAQWTDTMLRKWINEGGRDLARATRHVKTMTSIALLPGADTCPLDSKLIAVEQLFFDAGNGRVVELTPQHFEEWGALAGSVMQAAPTPTFFTTMGSQPNLTLRVWPTPSAGGYLTVFASSIPTEIPTDGSGDSTDLDIPPAWYDALADYAEFKALRRDRDPRWQEAYQLYQEKRDALMVSPDYLAVSRNMVADPRAGYVPSWLTDFD